MCRKINLESFLYDCRSGIQKAVRRGNLDLAKTCFDALWRNKSHRAWLKWRLPISVAEEAWYYSGEMAALLDSKSDEERDWRISVYELTLILKNKDAYDLQKMAALPKRSVPIKSYTLEVLRGLQEKEVHEAISDLAQDMDKKRIYETKALSILASRARQGGRMGDLRTLLACALLVSEYGVDRKKVREEISAGVKRWREKNRRKPEEVDLPWYVFDMHTRTGQQVLRSLAGRTKFSQQEIAFLWLSLESAFVPAPMQRISDEETKDFTESYWWPYYLRVLRFREVPSILTYDKAVNIWRSDLQVKIKKLILNFFKEGSFARES